MRSLACTRARLVREQKRKPNRGRWWAINAAVTTSDAENPRGMDRTIHGAERFHEYRRNAKCHVLAYGHLESPVQFVLSPSSCHCMRIARKLLTLPAVMLVSRVSGAPRDAPHCYRSIKNSNGHLHGYRNAQFFRMVFQNNDSLEIARERCVVLFRCFPSSGKKKEN